MIPRPRLAALAVSSLSVAVGGFSFAAPSHAGAAPAIVSLHLDNLADPTQDTPFGTHAPINAATVTADLSGSTAPAGTIFTIYWGDGATTDANPSSTPVPHTYTRVGAFTVTVYMVTPDPSQDGTARAEADVTAIGGHLTSNTTNVVDHSQVVLAITPPQIGPGQSITGYTYTFNRGYVSEQASTGPDGTSLTHTLNQAGTWTTSVVAQLDDGGSFTLTGPTITVSPTPIKLAAAITQTGAPRDRTVQVDLTGSAIDPTPPNSLPQYLISWGDGSSIAGGLPALLAQNGILSHRYQSEGIYTVTVSISDAQTQYASTSRTFDFAEGISRIAGSDRDATGIIASQAAFPVAGSAQAVVLARADGFADALSGIPLAKYRHAPLLITPGGAAASIDPYVANEIQRVLGAGSGKPVYILGGTSAIPQQVQDYITNTLHHPVIRYSGPDRYATALDIAHRGLGDPSHVVVARGDDYADALAAGPLAADKLTDSTGKPAAIVLTNGPAGATEVDSATTAYIRAKANSADPTMVVAVGGGAFDALTKHVLPAGPHTATGIVGTDRYDTAAKVATKYWNTGTIPVGIATGTGYADALTGGAYMATTNGPLLLTNPLSLAPAADSYITKFHHTISTVNIFGGTGAVSGSIDARLHAIFFTD